MDAGPDPTPSAESPGRNRFDERVVPHRRRSPLRLRDWRMRTKLATVLVIPSVAFLVLAGVQAAGLVGRTTALNDFAGQVGIGQQITTAVDRLQQERDRTAGELAALRRAGNAADRDAAQLALRPLHSATDTAFGALREAAGPLADSDAAWQVAYAEALEAYDQVVYIRAAVPPAVLSSDTILGNYHRAVEALLGLLAEPNPGPDRPELTDAVLRYVQLARVKELSSRIRGQLYAAGRAGRYGLEDQVNLTDLRAQQLAALGAFRVAATTGQIQAYDRTSRDEAFVDATRLEEKSITTGGTALPAVLPANQWWTASEQRQELLRQLETRVLDDAVVRADEVSGAQLRTTLLVLGGVVVVLALAVLLAVLVGRSIANSMQRLRDQALRIAQVELPHALDRLRAVDGGVPKIDVPPAVVRSLDEIGELAEAFVAVHRSAVSVAVEQAETRRTVNAMFVNLARRSQVLVERQLELLDDLEREEADPDQLENLFKLDHLAARMRRNDESLLVLAGTESTRRWNRPVRLGAVLLAASAEIEQYQRVRHESVADLYVVGHAVGELVHLMAELLENATAFSRPDTVVRVTARAEGGGAVVEIADAGLGMSPTALAQANAVLAAPPAADVAAIERMGHFVVSHLAARHGVGVRLAAAGQGLVARIALPATLLASAPAVELDASTGQRALTTFAPVNAALRPVEASRQPGPVRPADLPVAGRPPQQWPGVPDQRPGAPAALPVRAADVLAPVAPAPADEGGGWWSRQGPAPSSPVSLGESTPAPPLIPVTRGTNDRGLPVRVPMAQLTSVTEPARPSSARVREDLDPEAVGGMLSRLYSGVRRAEAEETTELILPPGVRSEGGRQ
ncbi:nitrate- and nitrite sensing domain-containing protein [Micromonospora matsumotoense]|uniref:sensor histidine kinase n=1 Tax=Micromonospora matsumotoense TaxID=121616 RepID=UPI0033C6FF6B